MLRNKVSRSPANDPDQQGTPETNQALDDVDTGDDAAARDWWRRGAPDDLADLLDAEAVE
ncbi:MAG: hypothetical protein MOB07_16330 [Acidobacteria bacterium]|nr:hypothetical protein [Acidobacteriota bacterium]